jgi:hypothetical protein
VKERIEELGKQGEREIVQLQAEARNGKEFFPLWDLSLFPRLVARTAILLLMLWY